jgi:hypothetical protein
MDKLNLLNGWAGFGKYLSRRSAQSYLNSNQMAMAASGCSSSCGSEDAQPQPSACGAGDDSQPKPSACGSSCGGDDK